MIREYAVFTVFHEVRVPVLPCITYAGRKITVIDGQPFYESSGQSSGTPGTWLPFIMVLEDFKVLTDTDSSYQSIRVPSALYGPYIRRRVLENQDGNVEDDTNTIGYFLLYNADAMHPTIKHRISARKLDALHDGLSRYLSLKSHTIVSIRLGGGIWQNIKPTELKERLKFDDDECLLSQEAYTLTQEPLKEIQSPSELNAWLLEQGAKDIACIFCSEGMADNAAEYLTYRLDMFIRRGLEDLIYKLKNRVPEPSSSTLGIFTQNTVQVLQSRAIAELMRYHSAIKSWIKQQAQKNDENVHEYILTTLDKARLIDVVTHTSPEFTESSLKDLQERLGKLRASLPVVEEHITHEDNSDTKSLSEYRAELIISIDFMGMDAQNKIPTPETALKSLQELHIDAHYAETQWDLDAIRMKLLELIKHQSFLVPYAHEIPSFQEICARKSNKPGTQSANL